MPADRRCNTIAQLSPGLARRFPFSAALWTRGGVSFRDWAAGKWGDCHMTIKASARSALIFAAGLLVCFAGPSPAMAAGERIARPPSKSESATSGKSARQGSRHLKKRYAHRKSAHDGVEIRRRPRKPTRSRSPMQQRHAARDAGIGRQRQRANDRRRCAPRQRQGDVGGMSAKANTILQAAADKPADAQAPADAAVVAPDQLNDVDRALQREPPATHADGCDGLGQTGSGGTPLRPRAATVPPGTRPR